MAWRRTGDKSLFEPMMSYVAAAYMRHSASYQWVTYYSDGIFTIVLLVEEGIIPLSGPVESDFTDAYVVTRPK